MLQQNPVLVQNVLLTQIHKIYTRLIDAHPDNGLNQHLCTGSRYNGNNKVEAYLSFVPNHGTVGKSIDLILALTCKENKAVFCSEIAWSDGKVIDDIVVCDMCPQCLDELNDRVERLTGTLQDAVIDRLGELPGCFQYN